MIYREFSIRQSERLFKRSNLIGGRTHFPEVAIFDSVEDGCLPNSRISQQDNFIGVFRSSQIRVCSHSIYSNTNLCINYRIYSKWCNCLELYYGP